MTLYVELLGCSFQTLPVPPRFPLLFNETFRVTKVVRAGGSSGAVSALLSCPCKLELRHHRRSGRTVVLARHQTTGARLLKLRGMRETRTDDKVALHQITFFYQKAEATAPDSGNDISPDQIASTLGSSRSPTREELGLRGGGGPESSADARFQEWYAYFKAQLEQRLLASLEELSLVRRVASSQQGSPREAQ